MSKLALGIIETIGLAAAVEAGDTAVKSANVKLIGYELSKGGGMVTVKIEGYVGAVKAAVEAGCIAAEKVSKVWSKKVIPRPHKDLEKMIITEETVGLVKENQEKESEEVSQIEKQQDAKEPEKIEKLLHKEMKEIVESKVVEAIDDSEGIKETISKEQSQKKVVSEVEVTKLENESVKEHKRNTDICNLCGNPKCPRKKGEPRKLCINYEKEKRRTSQ
ncbi:BMC domain-containing protein [Wukongibacter sp. M2B1]|uniref:BMC domain-containing protein n=1 Tax=Wukongibacter sp. M2B1 TaxID=3088895 RepID=UPI003D7BE52D